MHAETAERVVVLSPHLDDAVLSLGSWIANSVDRKAIVRVVTVMAGDPKGNQPASAWDLRCGFDSQVEATVARRDEDARACEIVGAEPVWLPFTNGVYGLPDVGTVWSSLLPHLDWADTVLTPGCPLRHPDHQWLATLLFERFPISPNLGLYLEQPYAARQHLNEFRLPSAGQIRGGFVPSVVPYGRDTAAIKRRAARSYASQLKPLSRRFPFVVTRLLRYESARGGESIAWLIRGTDEDSTVGGSPMGGAITRVRSNRSGSMEDK